MDRKIIFVFALLCLTATSLFSQSVQSIQNIGLGEITVLEEAGNGDLWVGSAYQGVAFLDNTLHTWQYYSTANTSQFKSDSITSISFGLIGGVKHAFIGTTNGLVYNHGGTWDTLALSSNSYADRYVTGVSLIASDTFWASTLNGLLAYDTTTLHIAQAYTTGTSTIPYNVTTVAEKNGNNCRGFTVGTPNNGVIYTTDGSTFSKVDTTIPNFQLVNNHVQAICIDNNCARRLIGTRGGFSECPTGIPCQNFTTANGMPQNDVTAVAMACNGDIWVGTRDSGIVVFSNATIKGRITTANGLTSDKITSISFTGGICTGYVGTTDGNVVVTDTADHVVNILNGVNDVSTSSFDVHVYPQPSGSQLTFRFAKELTNAEIYLTDISGRQLQDVPVRNASILTMDVSSLPSGLYFYRLISDSQQLRTGKVQVMR